MISWLMTMRCVRKMFSVYVAFGLDSQTSHSQFFVLNQCKDKKCLVSTILIVSFAPLWSFIYTPIDIVLRVFCTGLTEIFSSC